MFSYLQLLEEIGEYEYVNMSIQKYEYKYRYMQKYKSIDRREKG